MLNEITGISHQVPRSNSHVNRACCVGFYVRSIFENILIALQSC